jgi:mannose-6-phosphate isomerase
MLAAEFPGRNPGFCLTENTDDLFIGKSLLHGDVLMWLMNTLLILGMLINAG